MEGDNPNGVIDAGEFGALDAFAASWREYNGDQQQPVVWDVGANIGEYAHAVIRRFPEGVRVIAFEPQAGAYSVLEDGLAASDSWVPMNIGLSSEFGHGKLYKTSHPCCYLASTVRQSDDRLGVNITSIEEVKFFTGEQVMAQSGVGHIDWLKIDVEGHELEVLRGFGDMLVHEIEVVQFEYNAAAVERGIRVLDLWNMICPMFEVYRLDPDGTVTFIPEYDEGEEGSTHGGQRNYLGVHIECDWFRWEKDRPIRTRDCRQEFERDTGEAA